MISDKPCQTGTSAKDGEELILQLKRNSAVYLTSGISGKCLTLVVNQLTPRFYEIP